MSKLPPIQVDIETQRYRELLAHWMHEWSADQRLTEDGPASCTPISAEPDGLIEAGQIRLLHPLGDVTQSRPRYVTVLELTDDHALVASFSRFGCPATPGEWLTGCDTLLLQVLCLWNTINVVPAQLERSWVVSSMTSQKRQEALDVLEALRTETPLSILLQQRVGPPLVHPLDPRHIYLKEEREWLTSAWASDQTACYPVRGSQNLPMAAEDRDEYGSDRPRND